ncbi:transglycosylase SLT domain-containing protein [Acidimangrovimonas pyrenivorans]|uniref:Transglycosylase SLT domain-containing protein n=1 Tax=Acidimangrovimonas pyrenivorans TaxID=2030798 RepID=A0ABV7ANE4_9RHOB
MRALVLLLAALAALPAPARAEGWGGFYSSRSAPVAKPQPVAAQNACIRAILAAQKRYDIPNNLLLAIGLQEAGLSRNGKLTVWPWSVNAAGEGKMFPNAQAAMDWVKQKQAQGIDSIDVGCMQVNRRWHPDAFDNLSASFDPATNVDYAARFLVSLRQRTGDWMTAAGSYHSFNSKQRQTYLAALKRNVTVANARLDSFRNRAAGAAPLRVAQARPQPRIAWTSALSAGSDDRRLSIYSTAELQPVLPHFSKEF